MARLNAKTIAYDRPGSVAAASGWTSSNITATYGRLLGDQSTKNQRNIKSHVEGFLRRRGLSTATARPAMLVHAVDYAAREEARKQQNKQGFFDSLLGKVLVGAVQVGAGFIPGVGPAIAAGIGAAAGAAGGGGILGAATGALSGYGLGSAGQWMAQGGLGRLGATLQGKVPSVTTSSGWKVPTPGGAASVGGRIFSGAQIANTVLATVGGAAALGAAGRAVNQGGSGTTTTPRPTPTPRLDSTPEKDQERIRAEALRRTLRADRNDRRTARRNSWISRGAFEGRGDPRPIARAQPMATAA